MPSEVHGIYGLMLFLKVEKIEYSRAFIRASAEKTRVSFSFEAPCCIPFVIYQSLFSYIFFRYFIDGRLANIDVVAEDLIRPTFRVLIPVRSFSEASRPVIQFFASAMESLRSSSSWLNPSLIIPPSVIRKGGSSTTALSYRISQFFKISKLAVNF